MLSAATLSLFRSRPRYACCIDARIFDSISVRSFQSGIDIADRAARKVYSTPWCSCDVLGTIGAPQATYGLLELKDRYRGWCAGAQEDDGRASKRVQFEADNQYLW